MSTIADAQWEMMPEGNWWTSWPAFDSIYILAPVGSSVVNGSFNIFTSCDPYLDTTSYPTTFRQDSLYGGGFSPEVVKSFGFTLAPGGNCNYTYNFNYRPKQYEDTAIVQVTASSIGLYHEQINVIGITYIAASNEYSISRSKFDTLPPGDTEIAILRLFNQTPDTELVTASFSKGVDFNFLDLVNFPVIIPPGDTLPPIQVVYRANALRPYSTDSLHISIQRIREGSDFKSAILFGNLLTGGCNAKYYELSKTQFGYIAAIDSSTATLRLFNATADTESVLLAFTPQGDFEAGEGIGSPIIIPPYDSSTAIPITMHVSINRKAIQDTLVINAKWIGNGAEDLNLKFSNVLSGGCSDLRLRLDSESKSIYTIVQQEARGYIMAYNLSQDTLTLQAELNPFGYRDNYNYFFSYQRLFQIPPLDSAQDTVYLLPPASPGVWFAQMAYIDNYGIGQSDTDSENFVGTVAVDGVTLSVRDSLSIYPNPSSSEFRIEGMTNGSFFVIYNVLGNPVFQSKRAQDVWNGEDNSGELCRSGQYFAVIITDGNRTVIPILFTR
jgi:hypothetical protein